MDALGFDVAQAEGDNRRVKVGGLLYGVLDKAVRSPETAETIELTLDGAVVASAAIKSSDQRIALTNAHFVATLSDETAAAKHHRDWQIIPGKQTARAIHA